jgi:succinate dehydrogenase / fumarate reductase flavoprotein subunit
MHYQMGGIKTDVDGATRVPGIYAAGEVACVSVHGGNRLGANSLLDTIVFGRRSGRKAAEYARTVAAGGGGEELLQREKERLDGLMARPYTGETCAGLRLELATMMDEKVGLYRSDAGLKEALEALHGFRKRYENVWVGDKGRVFNQALTFVLELGYLLDCGETIIRDAMHRKESRGAHTHVDHPERNDRDWLKHTILTHRGEGQEPEMSYAPVTITKWQPEVRTY